MKPADRRFGKRLPRAPMTQYEAAYALVSATPGGMTATQYAVASNLPLKQARSVLCKAADYGGLDRVSVPLPNGGHGRELVYRAPRVAA